MFDDNLNILLNISYCLSELIELNYRNNSYDASLSVNYDITIDKKKHIPQITVIFKKDGIFNNIFSVTLEDRFKTDPVDLVFGLRFDDGRFNLLCRMVYGVDSFTNLYAEYSPKYTYPEFRSLYKDYLLNVNTVLQPENNWLVILAGVEHKLNKEIPLSLEIFRKEIDDFITMESANFAAKPVNIAKVSLMGFNLKEEWKIFKGFTQKLKYEYVMNSNRGDTTKFVPYVPAHTIDFSFDYVFTGWELGANLEYNAEQYYKEDVNDKLNPYVLFNMKISRDFSEWLTVFVKGENLLNQEYSIIKDYIYPGAIFTGGLVIKF